MRSIILLVTTVAALGCSTPPPAQAPGIPSVQLRPDQLSWVPYPAGGIQAFLVGNPSQAGPYAVRLRFPKGLRIPPHTHPDARVVTVLEGTMYFAFGTRFDSTRVQPFPAGSVWTELPNQPHFAWVRDGEVVLQISGTGPSGMTLVSERR